MTVKKPKPAKSGRQQDGSFAPGHSGNPAGRAAGSRNKATVLLDQLADADGEEILRKTLEDAKSGDPNARKLVLDRIWPVRKGRPVTLDLPSIRRGVRHRDGTGPSGRCGGRRRDHPGRRRGGGCRPRNEAQGD